MRLQPHINAASEITNEYVVPPEEDYSAYTQNNGSGEPVEISEEFIVTGGDN